MRIQIMLVSSMFALLAVSLAAVADIGPLCQRQSFTMSHGGPFSPQDNCNAARTKAASLAGAYVNRLENELGDGYRCEAKRISKGKCKATGDEMTVFDIIYDFCCTKR